jgi:hypothetical protein
MNYTTHYEITPKMQHELIQFYFFRVVFVPRIWRIAVTVAMLVFIAIFLPSDPPWNFAFVALIVLFVAASWVRTYAAVQRLTWSAYEMLDDYRMEVCLDEEGIRYAMKDGTRNFLWNKIRRIVESKDFIALMYGGLPLLYLPKSEFSDEALRFIREKSWVEKKD